MTDRSPHPAARRSARRPARLVVLPVVAITVVVGACGSSSSSVLETLPPIRTTTSTSSTSTTLDPRERVYIVQPGDNVNEIAKAYEVTAQGIIELNGLDEDGEIQPGQELRIPNVRVDVTLPTPPSTDEP
jgi:LysM repeat protein